MTVHNDRPTSLPPGHGIPRAFSIADLVPRANSPVSRSARVVNEATTGARSLFAGVFWSDPGAAGGPLSSAHGRGAAGGARDAAGAAASLGLRGGVGVRCGRACH